MNKKEVHLKLLTHTVYVLFVSQASKTYDLILSLFMARSLIIIGALIGEKHNNNERRHTHSIH